MCEFHSAAAVQQIFSSPHRTHTFSTVLLYVCSGRSVDFISLWDVVVSLMSKKRKKNHTMMFVHFDIANERALWQHSGIVWICLFYSWMLENACMLCSYCVDCRWSSGSPIVRSHNFTASTIRGSIFFHPDDRVISCPSEISSCLLYASLVRFASLSSLWFTVPYCHCPLYTGRTKQLFGSQMKTF